MASKNLSLQNRIRFLIAILLVIFGAFLVSFPAIQKINPPAKQPPTVQVAAEELSEKPVRIYIPKLQRTLNIADGYVSGDRWAISDTGVSYLTASALPGKTGNTIIYGHNTQNILGGLWRVQSGDAIYVVLANGEFVKYQASETKEVKPNQVEILTQTDDRRLTLYTCTGFLDAARFVVVAQKV